MALELFVSAEYLEAILDMDESSVYKKVASYSGVKAVVVDLYSKKKVYEGSVTECLDFVETMGLPEQYEVKIDLISLSDTGCLDRSFRPVLGPNESLVVEAGRVAVVENRFGWVIYLVGMAGPSKVLSITDLGDLKALSKDQLEELFSYQSVVDALSDVHRLKRFSASGAMISKKLPQQSADRLEGVLTDHRECSLRLANALIKSHVILVRGKAC